MATGLTRDEEAYSRTALFEGSLALPWGSDFVQEEWEGHTEREFLRPDFCPKAFRVDLPARTQDLFFSLLQEHTNPLFFKRQNVNPPQARQKGY